MQSNNRGNGRGHSAASTILLGCLATSGFFAAPAFADAASELRDEVAAQRARLDTLEKKLEAASQEATSAREAAQAAKSAQAANSYSGGLSQPPGEGLVYKNGGDTVKLYGLIDLSMSNKNNADKSGHTQRDMSVAWFSGNRWGLTGEHALKDTDGLKAIFRLESEFELPTGDMDTPGVLFNRDAWLGMESKSLGKLTFGRQNTLPREFSKIYGDAYSPTAGVTLEEGGYTNNNNFKQLIFYSGSATGTRYDKGIVWKKEFGAIVAGAAYQVGGTPGDTTTGSTKAVALAYNGSALNVSGFYNTANVNGFTDTSYSIGGNYGFGLVRLNTGWFHYKADQPLAVGNRTDNAYTISAKLTPAGKFDYELGWQTMNANNAAVNGSGFVLNAFSDSSTATQTATGKRKTLYGSVFYHYDKRTELYLAMDRLNTDGTYLASQAHGFRSQNEYAAGMRFKF